MAYFPFFFDVLGNVDPESAGYFVPLLALTSIAIQPSAVTCIFDRDSEADSKSSSLKPPVFL